MARSLSASITKPGSKCTRLCAFTIIVEIPLDMDEAEQINALNALERHGIERQALETVLWHLRTTMQCFFPLFPVLNQIGESSWHLQIGGTVMTWSDCIGEYAW